MMISIPAGRQLRFFSRACSCKWKLPLYYVISAGPVSEFRSFMQWNRPPMAATATQLTTQSSVVRTSPNCAKRLGTAGTLKYFVLELQLTNTTLPAKQRGVEFDVGLTGTINYNPSGSPAVRLWYYWHTAAVPRGSRVWRLLSTPIRPVYQPVVCEFQVAWDGRPLSVLRTDYETPRYSRWKGASPWTGLNNDLSPEKHR